MKRSGPPTDRAPPRTRIPPRRGVGRGGTLDIGQGQRGNTGPTAASMSRTASESGRLIRTTTSAPARATRSAADWTSVRARAFSSGGTLSCRSRMIASAPRVAADAAKLLDMRGHVEERAPDWHLDAHGSLAAPCPSSLVLGQDLPFHHARILHDLRDVVGASDPMRQNVAEL